MARRCIKDNSGLRCVFVLTDDCEMWQKPLTLSSGFFWFYFAYVALSEMLVQHGLVSSCQRLILLQTFLSTDESLQG